ncbi:ATP-binding cassette domain-containing protein [Corynebacterium sp. TAE3-ERU12]|uniref:ABC transporter ATP-binding protein n=1 Tax=Corynebacterium sp. TAE3-ERU12 TaxID=2849491 RepID=UPI001C4952FF|nr:ATP-binding cassette domain-containing protein [Corynebacterium sp. TAE3-ERU12]MBV7295786.1 ATP-binding cassette domain-containing protein [Corynebacterium sp. TAE3-ERU12]
MTLTVNGVGAIRRNRVIVQPTTVELQPGAHGLIGPNGAGKTSLLRLIAGHMQPSSGSVEAATVLARAGADVRLGGSRIDDHLLIAQFGHPELDRDYALHILADLGLSEDTSLRTLSTGQRQLVAVAVALSANAEVILLDEPFLGLDVATRTTVRAHLVEFLAEHPDAILIISSHRAEDLAGVVSDLLLVHHGEVRGPVVLDDIRTDYPILTGPTELITEIAEPHTVLNQRTLAGMTEVTISGALTPSEIARVEVEKIDLSYPTDEALIDFLAMTGTPEEA